MSNTPIFINGRFLTQRMTGVQRYALETLMALDEVLLRDGAAVPFQFTVLAPPGVPSPELQRIAFRNVGWGGGVLWEQCWLPFHSRQGLLLSFCPTGPLLLKRQVVTMHDASIYAVPDAFSWKFRLWYRLLLPILAERTPVTMTVSEFSKRELCRYLGYAVHRLHVSGEGWQHVTRSTADNTILVRHGLSPRSYVLAVSSMSPHKNLAVIARALDQLPLGAKVVVAGAVNDEIFGRAEPESLAGLIRVGYVTDAELLSLYEHAAAFVYPSMYEGFGLPPLEAMALGCPVICSRAAAMPEVCGDGALYFEPKDEKRLAELISLMLTDGAAREACVERGRVQLLKHSWEVAARAHLRMLEGLHPSAAPAASEVTGDSGRSGSGLQNAPAP